MGKLVQFQRGIATVIPVCLGRAVSQKASLRRIFNRLRLTDIEAIHMSYHPTPLRGSCRSAIALLALLANSPATAADNQAELEPLIVSALQVPRNPATVTSAVSVLDPPQLQNRGILQLRDALNESPGVIATSTSGQTGAPANIFIRGTTTKYTQVVIDGMRLSDSNNQLGHILAGGRTYDVGNIEILRGPQGAIYGGESIGGVLWMETPHGSGAPHGATTVEAGSFHSLAAASMFQGQTGDLAYYLSGGYEETANDAPHNQFHQGRTALRVEGTINPVWTIGTTFRANDSGGQDLDTSYSYDGTSSSASELSTIYATGKISTSWTARFRLGYYHESYVQSAVDTYAGPGWSSSDIYAGSISTDHEITLAENLRLLAGAFVHQDTYQSADSTGQNSARDGTRYGAHSTLEWDVIDALTTTASLRWEDYDVYGSKLTWRGGSIYTIAATGTTLRGGIGSSFRTPSYMELFYDNPAYPYYKGNPGLDSESSIGWDFGLQQKIGTHHTVEATWFHNQISNAIVIADDWSKSVNSAGNSTTAGLELGLRGSWLNQTLNYRLAWTYLDASIPKSGIPRNAATASLDWQPTPKSLIGIGATYLSDHTWGFDNIDAYTIARIYGSYQVTDKIKLHARLENAFNQSYYLLHSSAWGSVTQGAGTGLYAGFTVEW